MKQIEEILNFIVEIEKLKGVQRKTKPVGFERYENSAEHSWHVCLSALMLKDFANEPVNIERVIKMLLIHDLGEIDAGDTIIYASETNELKGEEATAIKRILSILPDGMEDELMELWYEFEAGETADSKFAKAVDRVPPLLHNIHGDGHSWKAHGITKDKVFSVNQRIENGSEALWSVMRNKLETAVDDGILK
ncbi:MULTISPECIES: HD domain-containing protein [Idiomarina]|jgi:putative hydrolase of HD superfamily|uniref:HD domain-containing protein n=1 Tax=Idiomarina TaxID=135575 RepID=UPI000C694194|nr:MULTISPECIES: HD domain-containing protein [Idiomarina]MAO68974.1 phosphohydrolase [Idiomarina sp.]MBF80977.1 phosphohydrolase [Idiomarina sp.]|tara:strand:- start:833 stop:1411 length:579 start_codon:yes stop_codon:yes gene_type:complete